jgi:excisionase family DNA binding protein
MEPNFSRAAFSIDEFAKSAGVGRDKIYDEIRAGRLKAKKAGRRTIITAAAARAYIDNLPDLDLAARADA